MNQNKLNIKIVAILMLLFSACNENILDKVPLDRYSDGTVWADVALADNYLKSCYINANIGFKNMQLTGVTDECFFIHIKGSDNYLLGDINADNGSPWSSSGGYSYENYSWSRFSVVQSINIFIANIDKVSDSYKDTEKASTKAKTDILKGEALFLRAFLYTQMCRTYGGLPIFKEPNKLGADFSKVTRSSFKETVDFIASDCDEAAKLLKLKSDMEMGRANKEAALALKSRILLFAASDLTADGTSPNELVGYKNPDRTALWTAAKNAAKAVIDLGTPQLADFGAPDKKAVAEKYFGMFKAHDLSNPEIIWGKMYKKDVGENNSANLRNGNNGNECYGSHCPTEGFVNEYEMEDGSKFTDHFFLDNENLWKNKSIKFKNQNPYHNREARFYGSVLFDSAVWQSRIYPSLTVIDPVGIYDRRTRKTIKSDGTVLERFGLDTRKGPVDAEDGSFTGYLWKKLLDDKTVGYYERNENVWIALRYAEIIMNYAEACMELGDIQTASSYINKIRNRAGLPNFTGDVKVALRHERKIEFAFEDIRWFDIRRWKILNQALTNAYGIDITEVTQGNTVTTTWKQILAQTRGPVKNKMYWIPIPSGEIKKAPQILQNPEY